MNIAKVTDVARRGAPSVSLCADQGFTIIELMIATAIMMVFMAAALTGVIEGQRGVNTVVARATDASADQSYLSDLRAQVQSAAGLAEYGGTGPYTELWIYNSNPPSNWPYSCTVWVYNAGTLEAFVASSLTISSPSPSAIGAQATGVRAQLNGISPTTGSGIFSFFSGYPGLVDVNLMVQYSSSGQQSDVQMASSPLQFEVEADDVNISTSQGLQALSTSNPSRTCY